MQNNIYHKIFTALEGQPKKVDNILHINSRVDNVSSPKKVRHCPKKSQIAVLRHIHKTCITKHKIDIKTPKKHQYNTIPLFRSIFFPCN